MTETFANVLAEQMARRKGELVMLDKSIKDQMTDIVRINKRGKGKRHSKPVFKKDTNVLSCFCRLFSNVRYIEMRISKKKEKKEEETKNKEPLYARSSRCAVKINKTGKRRNSINIASGINRPSGGSNRADNSQLF